jgi:hypothetical protein
LSDADVYFFFADAGDHHQVVEWLQSMGLHIPDCCQSAQQPNANIFAHRCGNSPPLVNKNDSIAQHHSGKGVSHVFQQSQVPNLGQRMLDAFDVVLSPSKVTILQMLASPQCLSQSCFLMLDLQFLFSLNFHFIYLGLFYLFIFSLQQAS